MATDHVIGGDAKLYYNTGTHASPTWALISNVGDVTVDDSAGEPGISTRESKVNMTGMGQIDLTFNVDYLHQSGSDSVFTTLQAASNRASSPAPVQLALMDQAIATSGSKGWRAFCVMKQCNQGQELEEGVKYDMSFKPTRHVESAAVVVADWYVVS